jgi:hypothetical protein
MPIVWVGDRKDSWEREAQQYLKLIAEKMVQDETTRQSALDLTKNCRTRREKLAALAAYVQSACTYQGIEFGRRGKVPNTSLETLRLHYGDCKDHALLLKQLLAATGIDSHLAIVNSKGAIAEELPSLDQFDHMVLFVPNEAIGEPNNACCGLVIDATEKDADPLLFPPYGLADKPLLVLDGAKPRFVRTPAYPPDAQQLTSRRRISVRPNASQRNWIEVDVQEQLTFNPYIAPGIRCYLRMHEAGKRREAIQEVLSEGQNVRVKRVDVENLDDTSKPLVLHLEYLLPDAFHRLVASADGNTLVGRIPSTWETYFLEAEYLDARETPFEVKSPKLIHTSLEIQLPNGYQLGELERWTTSGQTAFVAWASQAHQTGTSINVEHSVRVPAGQYAAKYYPEYYADMKEALSLLQMPVMFRERVLETADRPGAVIR